MASKITVNTDSHMNDMRGTPMETTHEARNGKGEVITKDSDYKAQHFMLAAVNGKFADNLSGEKKMTVWALTRKLQKGGVADLMAAEAGMLSEAVEIYPPYIMGQLKDLIDKEDGDGAPKGN